MTTLWNDRQYVCSQRPYGSVKALDSLNDIECWKVDQDSEALKE